MLPGHWLRGLSRSSKNRCGRAGRKPLRRCGTEIGAGARGKPAAEVRNENWCGRAGRKPLRRYGTEIGAGARGEKLCWRTGVNHCGMGAKAGVC